VVTVRSIGVVTLLKATLMLPEDGVVPPVVCSLTTKNKVVGAMYEEVRSGNSQRANTDLSEYSLPAILHVRSVAYPSQMLRAVYAFSMFLTGGRQTGESLTRMQTLNVPCPALSTSTVSKSERWQLVPECQGAGMIERHWRPTVLTLDDLG